SPLSCFLVGRIANRGVTCRQQPTSMRRSKVCSGGWPCLINSGQRQLKYCGNYAANEKHRTPKPGRRETPSQKRRSLPLRQHPRRSPCSKISFEAERMSFHGDGRTQKLADLVMRRPATTSGYVGFARNLGSSVENARIRLLSR